MPRAGHKGILDETQVRHLMALLLDPQLPGQQSDRPSNPAPPGFLIPFYPRWQLHESLQTRIPPGPGGGHHGPGMSLGQYAEAAQSKAADGLYDIPRFGNVSFLHMTDCHAQLKPIHFREPSINLGIGSMRGNLPHLVGEHLLKVAKVRPGSAEAHALSYLDYEKAARRYGKVGGFAHLATLVKRLKAQPPGFAACSMAATPGRVRAPACGPTARTWSTPASCWAWT